MQRRARPRGRVLGLALIAVLACGCRKGSSSSGGSGERSAASRDDRVPALSAEALGVQPGHMAGAFAYASWQVGAADRLFAAALPPATRAKVLGAAEVAGLKLDPEHPLTDLGLVAEGHVSVSARVLDEGAAELRTLLDGGAPMSGELAAKIMGLGVHLRLHLPTRAGTKLGPVLQALDEGDGANPWAETCAKLEQVRACVGNQSKVAVVREVPGGLRIDALVSFAAPPEPQTPQPLDERRRQLLVTAVEHPGVSEAAELAGLRGQANMLLDGAGVVSLLRTRQVALRQGERLDEPNPRASILDEALAQLHETERIFSGVALELAEGEEGVVLEARWLPTPSGREQLASLFELGKIDADVPTIAALCEGAVLCARTRGLPARQRFAGLATGVYGQPLALADLLDDHGDAALVVLALETWPNAIGTAARLPGTSIEPPQSFFVDNLLGVADRVLGSGLSLRSIGEGPGFELGDWLLYYRMASADINALQGMLEMARVEFSSAEIAKLEGRILSTASPEPDFPGRVYLVHEPTAATGEWGWIIAADSDERLTWLAGLAHDDGALPIIYLEAPDLATLAPALGGRLASMLEGLAGRSLRARVNLVDGAPQLRVAIGSGEP